jgi:uncharacterized protein YecE (DUF72 family)
MAGKIRIGMSGWTFDGWKGTFYPEGVPKSRELEYASRKVSSIEVNGTFYSLQKPETFSRWHDETPGGFVFSIKAPQYITHVRRLKECDEALATFLASGLFCLKRKLGPILWQFPPNVTLKDDRFQKFLEILPHTLKDASRIAKNHSPKMSDRVQTDGLVEGDYRLRHAFEFRHPSFLRPEFIELLRKHGVALVFAHSGLKSPYAEDLTADFVYARMHGQEERYSEGYAADPSAISWWGARVKAWSEGGQPADALCVAPAEPARASRPGAGKDAFIYFDTEAKEHAPGDAQALARELGLEIASVEAGARVSAGVGAGTGVGVGAGAVGVAARGTRAKADTAVAVAKRAPRAKVAAGQRSTSEAAPKAAVRPARKKLAAKAAAPVAGKARVAGRKKAAGR